MKLTYVMKFMHFNGGNMAYVHLVACLACVSSISKAIEKRNICNSSSERIVSLWKRYLKCELEQRSQISVYESNFTDLGEVRTTHNGNQKNICRKCFYAFENFISLKRYVQLIVPNIPQKVVY